MTINRTQKDLNKMLSTAIEQVTSLGLNPSPIDETIYLTRATKTYGKCERIDGGFAIHVSKYFKDNDEGELMNMLVHEVLHTVPNCFDHGKSWKSAAELANKTFGYNISRLSNFKMNGMSESQKEVMYKYIIVCEDCGNELRRQRKSKLVTNVEKYTCGACGGRLFLK